MAEDMYGTNYYCNRSSDGGERVPIKSMAPESIDTKIYNKTADVVSTYRQHGYIKSDYKEVGEMTNYHSGFRRSCNRGRHAWHACADINGQKLLFCLNSWCLRSPALKIHACRQYITAWKRFT